MCVCIYINKKNIYIYNTVHSSTQFIQAVWPGFHVWVWPAQILWSLLWSMDSLHPGSWRHSRHVNYFVLPSHAAVVYLYAVNSRQETLSKTKTRAGCQRLSLLDMRSGKIWSCSINLNCMVLQNVDMFYTVFHLHTHSNTKASPSSVRLKVFTIYNQFIASQDEPNWNC